MEIQYSKQAIKFLNRQDTPTKKHIVNAINSLPSGDEWDNIEVTTPDEWDMEMLREIQDDPDCHQFVASDEVMK